MTTLLAALVASAVALVVAGACSSPTYADGSRVTRGHRTPWGDVAALFGHTY